jgi:glycosyltransferase involved in cell wall biosynthesis
MNKRLSIVYILPCLEMGGAERVVTDLIKNLDPKIFACQLICLKPITSAISVLEQELTQAGFKPLIIGRNQRLDLLALFRLYRFFRKQKPDIVHTHLFSADIYGRIIARLARVPVVISTIHNINIAEGKKRRLIRRWTKFLVTMTVAVSQFVKDYVLEYDRVSTNKLMVIHNGIDIFKFSLAHSTNENPEIIRLGSVGRLTSQKSFNILIEALSLCQVKFICSIVGEGEERANLEKLINDHGLDKAIKLIGKQTDVPKFLSNLDVFILTSSWEGLPLVILEAGAANLPVISSDLPNVREIIEDQKNGLLFKTGDVKFLAQLIDNLAKDDRRRIDLAKALQEKINSSFSVERMAEQYAKLYLFLVK